MDNNKNLEGIDILIIEDDKIFAKILSDYLISMGAKVRLSYDGLDGPVDINYHSCHVRHLSSCGTSTQWNNC